MSKPEWYEAVSYLHPYLFKISTPQGFGTGFLLSVSKDGVFCGVATAAHVVSHADSWEQPIRIQHVYTEFSKLIKADSRVIFIDDKSDAALILFETGDISLPEILLSLTPQGKMLNIGNQIGWLGFPALSPGNLCFFSGMTSSYLPEVYAYLVDGVAINGVSGGPAFVLDEDSVVTVVGVVSAYIPNRATGEALPGLAYVTDVAHFNEMIDTFRSLDDAKEEEPDPTTDEDD